MPFLLFMPVEVGRFYNTSYPVPQSSTSTVRSHHEGLSEGFINGLQLRTLFFPCVKKMDVALNINITLKKTIKVLSIEDFISILL